MKLSIDHRNRSFKLLRNINRNVDQRVAAGASIAGVCAPQRCGISATFQKPTAEACAQSNNSDSESQEEEAKLQRRDGGLEPNDILVTI